MRSFVTAIAALVVSPALTLSAATLTTGPGSLSRSIAVEAGVAGDRKTGRTLGEPDRFGSAVARGAAAEQAPAPVMTIDKASLTFGAVTSGSTFSRQTGAQALRLTQAGAGAVSWTAASSSPWLQVSPASGTGSATLTVTVSPAGGVPSSGVVNGTVVVTYNGATSASGSVPVALRLYPAGASAAPFGVVDTPTENASGVIGAIPVTGWALDDVDIAAVSLCRAPVAGEGAAGDARCGGAAQIYIGDAVFIEGARGDVPVAFPNYPRGGEAGWGTMLLTNFLPGEGNGAYTLSVWARDVEGASTLLGSRTINCDNANAKLPFGTIDTPAQGETISGSQYVNFGWALTQQPKIITKDLLSMLAYVDGVVLGPVEYGFYRSDIATLFPGRRNSDAPVGYRILEPNKMANGLHTLVWVAQDSGGFVEGLGSRYFRIIDSPAVTRSENVRAAAATASTPAADAPTVAAVPLEALAISGRRGWNPNAPWRRLTPGATTGRIEVSGEELDRFELQLSPAAGERFAGYLRSADRLQPLPVGSHLDAATGVFTWAPGAGFVGPYDLVFVRGTASAAAARTEIRVTLRPKGSGPQVVIDTPGSNQQVDQPFVLAGWAADLAGDAGTGIDTLHVWAYPVSGAAPVFLGVAGAGDQRPDVAAAYGDQFADSGYSLVVQSLDQGAYDIAVFAWSSAKSGFLPARVVRVNVR